MRLLCGLDLGWVRGWQRRRRHSFPVDKNPSRMPEKHLFSSPVLASIFQSTPISTNSLMHKYYFHTVALVCARIIYIYWNCVALSGPEPSTRPGPTIEETQRNALPPACQEGAESKRKHRQKED